MKKQQKRTLKKKLFFGIMLFSAIFILFLSNTANTTTDMKNASTTEDQTLSEISHAGYSPSITVDCLRLESAYERIIDDSNYEVWYANNATRHFIFINSTSYLTGKEILIYTEEFNYSLTPEYVETPFLLSYHVNNTLEFAIERILLGYYGEETNDFNLLIDTDLIQLHVGPASPSFSKPDIPPLIVEEEGEKEVVVLGAIESLFYNLEKMSTSELIFWVGFWISFFWLGAFYIKKKHQDYFKNPRLFVQNNVSESEWNELIPKKQREKIERGDEEIDYKRDIIKLGRYLKETESKLFPGYYVLSFKHARHFILKVYCKERYADIDDTKKDTVLWVRKEQWEYELRTLPIPPEKQYEEEIIDKTLKNRILLALGRIIPSKKLPLILYEKLKLTKTGKKTRKVFLLRNIYDSEYLTVVADVKFKRLKPTETNPKNYVSDHLDKAPWYQIELLKRDRSVIFDEKKDISNISVEIVKVEKKYRSLFRSTADNEKSTHEFRESAYIEDIKKRNKIIHDLTFENAQQEKELQIKETQFMREVLYDTFGSKKEMLLDFKSDLDLSGNVQESAERALEREQIRKKMIELEKEKMRLQRKKREIDDPDYVRNLETKLASLKMENEALRKGDGRPQKEKDLLEELGIIKENTEEEEEDLE